MLSSSTIIVMVTIAVYLIAMVVIGVICSKKTASTSDFYLGGRGLGPLVTAMSAEASDMSSWLLMGLPGVALITGLPEAFWTALGLAIGTYVNWLVVAKRIRIFSNKIKAITVPQFISKRYKDKGALSFIAALFIVVFFIPYTASGFNACGTLFSTLFGVDYFPAMLISAIVIVAYTSLGGFLAASMTDLIQSFVMTGALLIVVIFGVTSAGGLDAVINNATSLPGYLNPTQGYDPTTGSAATFSGLSIFSTLAWGLGYFGMPHVLLRFMAIKNPNQVKTSRRIATIWVVISMAIAVFIGIVGCAMINAGTVEPLDSTGAQRIIVIIASILSSKGFIFAIGAGVIIAGILASTMSTSDSQLLAASSSITEDIAKNAFGIKLSEKKQMLLARLTVIIIAVIGIIWAREESSVFVIVSFAWAGFGAAFGPTVLLALFWKRSNKYGAISGMLAGGGMVFVWKYLIRPLGGGFDIYELLPAFITGLAVNIIVSLCTKAPDQEIIDTFDAVSAEMKVKN